MEVFSSTCGSTTEMADGASTIRSGARDAPSTTSSVNAIATGSSSASTVMVAPGSTVTELSVGRYPSHRKTTVWDPSGTRRRVYRPSGLVTVVRVLAPAWIVTDTLGSGDPSPARLTVPVTVPVSCAATKPGSTRERRKAVRQTPRNEANRGSGIGVLIGGWLGVPPRRHRC